MSGSVRTARAMKFLLAIAFCSVMPWERSVTAQEVIFLKSLTEAEQSIEEARNAKAEEFAPDDYLLALSYLTQAKDEAIAYKAEGKDKKPAHLFSARQSGEAVNLLAEKARYQARLAATKATEVRLYREIVGIKAQIVEGFNTGVTRDYTPLRDDLWADLSDKELQWKDARKARELAESEIRKFTLEGEFQPAPK